jgi:heme oxygenase
VLPLLPSGERYARRVAAAAAGDGSRLLAHAWTRYLGDLNGGRILGERLRDSLGLGADALSFCAYPEIEDLAAFRRAWREAFDAAGAACATETLVDEALAAFRLNIDVSEEVARAAALPGGGRALS